MGLALRQNREAPFRAAARLPAILAVLCAGLLPLAGAASGHDAVSAQDFAAARMYDEAVEQCGAGNVSALHECNRLLRESTALVPDQALAFLTLGHTYRTMRQWDAAVAAFDAARRCTRARAGAVDAAPPWAAEDAGLHLGRALIELDRWDDAIIVFEATYTTFPHASEVLYRHLYLQHFACNFTRRGELLGLVRERVPWEVQVRGGSAMTPSQALMMLDGEELLTLSQSYAAGHLAASTLAAAPHGPWQWVLDPSLLDVPAWQAESRTAHFSYSHLHLLDGEATDGRLRVGYVSKDWGFSSVGQLLPRLLSAHNRRRLQVHVYCLNEDDGTPTRAQLREAADRWHDLHTRTPVQVAEQINVDGINIAVDLGGHLSVTSQVALALQPAPIAVNYLSWLATSGAPYIQTFLTDSVATPPEYIRHHSEAVSYLPYSYQVNSNRYMHTHHYNPKARYTLLHPPHQPQGPPPPVTDDAVVFANFNQLFKIDPETAHAWAQILAATPDSVLTMLNFTGAPEGSRRLQRFLTPTAAAGSDRVLFSPFCASKHDFLLLAAGADIFLDNFFYNAGTTGSDVMFVGLPVLTRPGARTLARMGASLAIKGLGYAGLVVRDAEDYVALARALARNRRRLARVRSRVHRQQRRGSLFDADRWVEAYEVFLHVLWDAGVSGGVATGGGQATQGQRHLVIAALAGV